VPRRDIIELDLTVEAAMTLLMSAGMAQPGGSDQQSWLHLPKRRVVARAVSALARRREVEV